MVQRRNRNPIKCQYFAWLVYQRNDVYQADGRGNQPSVGRHSLGTKSYEQALKNLKELDLSIAVDKGLAPCTVAQAAEADALTLQAGEVEYREFVARPRALKGTGKNTQKRYRAVFNKAVRFFRERGIQNWNDVTQGELQAYATNLERKRYSHATQVLELVTLKQAINHWIEKGLLPAEQGFKLEVDKVTESTTYCYTAAEVVAMITHCREKEQLNWLADVIIGLAYTGMRIGELVQLRWSAVNFDHNMITVVDDSRSTGPRHGNARATKSGKSRLVPIYTELRVVLERLHMIAPGGLVFRAPRGGPLHPRNVLQAFIDDVVEPLKEKFSSEDGEVGFATGRLHSLRHFFCSQCANDGVSERVLMEWLGHASSVMLKRYYHLNNQEAQLQMSKLGRHGVSA